jgi:hypothetical protein
MNARRVQVSAGILGAVMLLGGAPLGASPWSLISCDPSGEQGWQAFKHAMRLATANSTIYVPVPFPTTSDEVVKDFLYQRARLLKGLNPKQWQPSEPRVIAALSSGKVKIEVVRAENWSITRCRIKEQENDFYELVRIFEAAGTEVARGVVGESGIMMTWIDMPAAVPGHVAAQSRDLPPAATAMAQINRELGLNGEDPEYVVTSGTLECFFSHPCLAFHHSGLSYIAYGDELFEVSASGPTYTLFKDVASPAEDALMRSLAPGEKLVSLGGIRFSVAHPVDPAMIRSGKSAFAP